MKRGFIFGNPRSGTSLFRLMLNAHPDILAAPECGFMQWWHKKYSDWSSQDNFNSDLIEQFIADVLSSRKMETWGLTQHLLRDIIIANNPQNYAALAECVYLTKAAVEQRKVTHIVDKNNYYINHLSELYTIWPDAKALFIIRDGRDVACSYRDLEFVSEQTYKPKLTVDWLEIASEWNSNNLMIYQFLTSQLKKENWLMIRYEDLVRNPKNTLESVCHYLEIEFHTRMLEYYMHNDEPGETIDWKKKTLQAPDISGIGRYKSYMTDEEQLIFNQIAEQGLKLAKYV